MINRKTLAEDQARHAIDTGEFGREVTASADTVVVIMTQDWCPQWAHMKGWLDGIQASRTVDIYELEYNKVPYFNDFMRFKENTWNNSSVPYMRFYKNGSLFKETNYINRVEFAGLLD